MDAEPQPLTLWAPWRGEIGGWVLGARNPAERVDLGRDRRRSPGGPRPGVVAKRSCQFGYRKNTPHFAKYDMPRFLVGKVVKLTHIHTFY